MSEWEHEMKPVLEAVRAISEEGGGAASQASINAQLEREDEDPRTDQALADLVEAGYVSGPEMDQRKGPLSCRLTEKGRQEVSGWPRPTTKGSSLVISDSTIGQLAMGDINNLTLAGFFEAWENQLEASTAPEAEKNEAREALHRAKEMVAQATTGAAGALLADALRASLGGLAG